MIHGLDTGFLVAVEIIEHADHAARALLARLLGAGDRLALTPQLLAEFMHIVTDPRRFSRPLAMMDARRVALEWWLGSEVEQIFLDTVAIGLFLVWMEHHRLGRKCLLDTQLAATYQQAGVTSLLTTDPSDFEIFGAFTCLTPGAEAAAG